MNLFPLPITSKSFSVLLSSMHSKTMFALPDILKLPPISHHGNVNEIIGKFGGADQLRNAVNQLQSLLYSA